MSLSSEAVTIMAAVAVALTATILLPIYITRKRLKGEWARYNDSKRRFEEMRAAGGIDPATNLPFEPVEEPSEEGHER